MVSSAHRPKRNKCPYRCRAPWASTRSWAASVLILTTTRSRPLLNVPPVQMGSTGECLCKEDDMGVRSRCGLFSLLLSVCQYVVAPRPGIVSCCCRLLFTSVPYYSDCSMSFLSLVVCLFVYFYKSILSFSPSLSRSDEFMKCEKTMEAMDPHTNVLETIIILEVPTCNDPYTLRPDTRRCMSCPDGVTYKYVQMNMMMHKCHTFSGLIQYGSSAIGVLV